jgi:hypothetical protein
MAIYTDATNRYYLGDVLYGNHDILNSTVFYTKADKVTGGTLNTDLESIATSLGYGYRRTGDLRDLTSNPFGYFEFGFPSEPTRARFAFFGNPGVGHINGRGDGSLFSNTDYYLSYIFGKGIASTDMGESPVLTIGNESALPYERQVCGSFSDRSFSIFWIRRLPSNVNIPIYFFAHASFLQEGTIPAFTTNLGKCCVFAACGRIDNSHVAAGWHYDVGNSVNKQILSTGNAFYNITCADLQTPGAQHASGFYVLYNDNLLYPMMGRYPDLLYAQGTYIIGKPVKIDGAVFPDLGHNHWLPVARWGSFTILMRCYSSLV